MPFISVDWSTNGYYKFRTGYPEDSEMGYGLRAVKTELAFNGFNDPPMKDNAQYGTNTKLNVLAFKKAIGLAEVTDIGPATMRALCHKRVLNFEEKMNIPNHYLCKQLEFESAFCPYCTNTSSSGVDKGIAQLHFENDDPTTVLFPFNGAPVVESDDWADAFKIGRNVKFLAQYMQVTKKYYDERNPELTEDQRWLVVIFSWNAPAWAKEWADAGLPATGGAELSEEFKQYSGCETRFEWATLYCKRVTDKEC